MSLITNIRYPIIDKRKKTIKRLFEFVAVVAIFTSLVCVWMVAP